MLTHHRRSVCLSLVSTDLPVWSVIETAATLYQKDSQRFHLLLTEPRVLDAPLQAELAGNSQSDSPASLQTTQTPRLLWLEISPYRVIMTMQGNGKYSYRHFWEQGVYGLSRYWLQSEFPAAISHLRLRNFTRSLWLQGEDLPQHLRVEYELWSDKVQLGSYVLNLEIDH
ncbi:hypothetical protein BST81_02640 [Leptolyngbya sp. 'hensonii']|uniref:hypothetical protein n=1 Tax=Leptolyngbya sp. 'hensonii' TaxID=1922337 RepID=UPI00094F909D|nr:hypothetical protein [Leptolyngbya sp. 'hensonii']OLP19989.1 hypothetical protein BST81_02640 [Leptolyngbya sp. 'hensonii']